MDRHPLNLSHCFADKFLLKPKTLLENQSLCRLATGLPSSARPPFPIGYTSIKNSIMHWSSCRIIRIMLPIVLRSVSGDKDTPAQSARVRLTSHCLVSQTFESESPIRKQPRSFGRPNTPSIHPKKDLSNSRSSGIGTTQHVTKNRSSTDLSDGSFSGWGRNSSQALIRPKCSLHSAAFNVPTFNQIGQQDALFRNLETFKIDICCLRDPDAESYFRDHSS